MEQKSQPSADMQVNSPSAGQKKVILSLNKMLIFGMIGFFLVALITGSVYFSFKLVKKAEKAPEDIRANLLSTPLFGSVGEIKAINGAVLQVLTQAPDNSGQQITYNIKITSHTRINSQAATVNYTLEGATPSAQKKSISHLKIGQQIEFTSGDDLRKLSSNEFEALSITTAAGLMVIEGKIIEVTKSMLRINAQPPSVPIAKDYTFKLDGETDILLLNTPPISSDSARSIQIPVEELKKDAEIVVYSDLDVNFYEDLKALKIAIIKP